MSGRRLIPVVPTALTLGNLVCGFLAMAKLIDALQLAPLDGGPLSPLFGERVLQACWLLIAGMIFDALDGRVARLMKASSAFGVQLDSLADVVSFGLAPALMAKVVYEHTMRSLDLAWRPGWVTTLCALYLMGAALRLARFNVAADSDEKSHDVFMGLPSPAAALTIAIQIVPNCAGDIGISREQRPRLEQLADKRRKALRTSAPPCPCDAPPRSSCHHRCFTGTYNAIRLRRKNSAYWNTLISPADASNRCHTLRGAVAPRGCVFSCREE